MKGFFRGSKVRLLATSSQKTLHICESGPTTERGARARPQASLLERMI